jgi:hypothetical protein
MKTNIPKTNIQHPQLIIEYNKPLYNIPDDWDDCPFPENESLFENESVLDIANKLPYEIKQVITYGGKPLLDVLRENGYK